jgi:7,8-dihydroneopterin aldolase/epimerase/oxygenase
MTEDRITLRGIRAAGRHGVFDFEREQGQEFVVDVIVHTDLRAAASSDDLSQTIHYGELAEEVAALIAGDPVDLIETVAERIADAVLAHDAAERVEVTVHKPQAPISVPFDDVAVTVVRTRGVQA